MTGILQNYLPLVVFIGVASLIGLALLIAPFLVAYQQPDPEKLSAYECGFNAFDDARMKFDVRFYLVAILFIIFDLEVAFLFRFAGSGIENALRGRRDRRRGRYKRGLGGRAQSHSRAPFFHS